MPRHCTLLKHDVYNDKYAYKVVVSYQGTNLAITSLSCIAVSGLLWDEEEVMTISCVILSKVL